MKDKIKILFITHYAELYGANRSLIDILTGLSNYPVEPIVLLPYNGDFTKKLDELNIKHIIYHFRNPFLYRWKSKNIVFQKLNNLRFFFIGVKDLVINWVAVRKIKETLQLQDIDLIYSNSAVMTIGEDLSRNLEVPHIHQIRELPKQQFSLYPNLGATWYYKKINSSQLQIFNSKYTKDNFNLIPRNERSLVIYNEIAVPLAIEKLNLPENIFNLGIFGYLSSQKNQKEAIEALSQIDSAYNVKLYIIGGGSVDEYMDFANSQVISDKIEFVGFTDNVGGYLKELDAVLVCAKNEALGRATIEAMLAGRCVIGKRSGATPELIIHKQNGLLYDTVDELVESIEFLYNNPIEMIRMATKTQHLAVTKFSSGKSIRSIYNEIVKLIE